MSRGAVFLFTGLSGAGKTTICDAVVESFESYSNQVYRLDGDIGRTSYSKDLGFSEEDRNRNVERAGAIASYLEGHEQGIVLASYIAPYREKREWFRSMCNNFYEIYIKCPIEVCEERDVKGLYKLVREGKIKSFTGIHDDAPYEEPQSPDLILDTSVLDLQTCMDHVLHLYDRPLNVR